ncbi:MAG: glycosyltransferase family 4 protein [Coriobacteriia bacterium]|nr:glycosyltransferase family 4 protein [Coriobacteriia bacterium]
MRIGFFTDTYTPQINGVVTSIRLFKTALEARGHQVYVFAPEPGAPDDTEDIVRFLSIPFVFQPEMRFASPISFEALRLLDHIDLDIVHAHDPFSIGLFGLNIARRQKIPYVHTYHTMYPEYVHYVWETKLTKRLAERLSRDYCDACDSVVAPSTKVEEYLLGWGVSAPIEIIATGVDIDKYAAEDPDRVDVLRKRLGLAPEDRIALFVGRLGREKNVETLVRAIWHCECPAVKLLIVGDGPHRRELEELTDELDLRGRVVFAGYLERDDTIAAYHLAHIFAFASTSETQGLVVGEAMAAGLPVVAAEDKAVEDFVIDGTCGLVVPGIPDRLAAAMDALLLDEPRRLEYAAAATLRAQEFSIAREAARLEAHYLRAIENYHPRSFLPTLPELRRALKPMPKHKKTAEGSTKPPRTRT